MFFKRSYSPEIMDDLSIQDERIDKALIELRIINKFLGGNSVTKEGIKKIIAAGKLRENLKILDIGAGASDVLLAPGNNFKPDIYTIDINKRACRFAKLNSTQVKVICADANHLPLKEKYFDVIHASLFFHHFDETQIKNMLINFLNMSNYGIVINDLRRSIWAYLGIKILTAIFSGSRMVKNDGPLSVRRGFTRSDFKNILPGAGIKNYLIKRKWAFRWLIVIYK